MDEANTNTPRGAGIAATLEVRPPDSFSAATNPAACPRVAFVEGSDSGMSGETRYLLRKRLRAAAVVFFCGSMAFYLRSLIWPHAPLADPKLARSLQLLEWFQIVQIVTLGLVTYKLCWRCNLSLRALRIAEAIIFGLTAIFLACTQYVSTQISLARGQPAFNPVGIWFCLMFTYAIYIPNTWRRAAFVLSCMTLAPLVVMLLNLPAYSANAVGTDFDTLSGVAMLLALGLGSSIYGTYMINELRQEAFEARRLGQYRLKRLIGAGGMGEVYLAEHQLMKRPCALKLIRPGMARDPRALARFEREVRATAKLSHWNTVEIFDYGHSDDGTFYYVMEYLPGLSLSELVERYGPLPPERIVHLLAQTCDALAEAHSFGLIHRDIKPGNIFAAQRGGVQDVAKLLDFGLAKPLTDPGSSQLTQEGTITGSPLYMSPEQALGEVAPDARSDIYSLGGVAYFLLTGKPPFENSNPMRVLISHAHDEVVPPSQLRADVPGDLEGIILRCLQKSPIDRFPSAATLGAALRDCAAAGAWTRDHAEAWWAERPQAVLMPEPNCDGLAPAAPTNVNLPKGVHV